MPRARLDAHHLRHEGRVLDDQVLGDAAGPDDLLAVIDVVHEGVERAHALLDAGRQPAPFGGAQDARDDVEGDEPLGGRLVAVDGEGDAGAAEQRLGLAALALEIVDLLGLQPLDARTGRARAPRRRCRSSRRMRLSTNPPRVPVRACASFGQLQRTG